MIHSDNVGNASTYMTLMGGTFYIDSKNNIIEVDTMKTAGEFIRWQAKMSVPLHVADNPHLAEEKLARSGFV